MSTFHARTRLGAVALAVAGVLFLAYPALRPWHDEATVSGATAALSSAAWVAAHLFAMIGFILLPLGLLALLGVVATTRSQRLALVATVITWIGAGLTLPYYGAEDFGLHAIAGPKGSPSHVLDLIDAVRYQPVAVTIFGTGLILLAIGAIVAAVAVWHSGVLPRWSGILFAAGLALFLPQFFTPAPVRIAHGVLMAVGLIVFAVALWRSADPARAAVDPHDKIVLRPTR
ncbi:hypothetical protein [Actinopolymorpha pittospori]|uniref:DUF4386 family protein n=1 Tax=Actinopolymorpha pittospori TaxID=648752 RepID=A0A927N3G0_9ACTN|nr:hypothetical protein [Actinopolymorpha pittospori]MBE1610268.1 hypothetical protein [Actinopolymorpha pittospori]